MGAGEKTFGDRDTLRGVTGGAAWQAAEGLTFGELDTLRDEGVVLAGRYKVVKRLGEGGMGSVWLAEDAKLDGRKVAVKMLPAILVGKKGAYRQVKAEAMVAMKLSHSNIATVRAFEEDEGGNPFLVMDYIEGEGLDDILAEKGALGEEETVRLLGPVAAALDYAHSQGVVHRDMKPGNVMVRKDGTPFVLDFGIAREVQETMTRVTGKLSSGTLLYMSPEQLHGRAPKAAQDVYSFAAMAYECLTGRPPFSRGQIEYQIDHDMPEELPGNVGATLRQGVMAGLAKEAGGRPGSCAGVLGGRNIENSENRCADSERRVGEERKEKGENGDVFLRKVRLEKELNAVDGELATREERAELGIIRDLWEAGTEALKTGARADAEGLFGKAENALNAWRTGLEERKAKEQEESGARKKAEEERRREETKRRRAGATKTITLPGGASMELVWCPPGSFLMGTPKGETDGKSWVSRLLFGPESCDDETPHTVTLTKGFWLAKTEVTQKQWKSVMGSNPSYHKGGDLPVEQVSWEDCQQFCQKAGLELPTEAEWEYACRAGTTGNYGGTGRLDDMGWYGGGSSGDTHPVGQKKANAWGLLDMHGNVWEWCADWYDRGYYAKSAATDPKGPASGESRVLRGGSCWSLLRDCRSANRFRNHPHYRVWVNGFRPVLRQD